MTPSNTPVISAVSAGPVSPTGATLQATVNPNGTATSARFQYSTDPSFTPTVATTLASGFNKPLGVAVDGAGDVFVADTFNNQVVELSPPAVAASPAPLTGKTATAVTGTLTGLRPSTTYYYRAVAASADGLSYGGDWCVARITLQISETLA
jgi:hypothetical protein